MKNFIFSALVILIVFSANAQNYCSVSWPNSTAGHISNVSLTGVSNSINETSGWTSYSDYTNSCVVLAAGNSYDLNVTMTSTSFVLHTWYYIDWNDDGDFSDAGEAFDMGQTTGGGTLTSTINVPGGQADGDYRIRIVTSYNTDPTNACTVATYGETEDYCLTITSNHCYNGVKDSDETQIDCGGVDCDPCGTCSDGIQNGEETWIDCGGSVCAPCGDLCSDGIQNGDETGVDCGGAFCISCTEQTPGASTDNCSTPSTNTVHQVNCDQIGTSAFSLNSPEVVFTSTSSFTMPTNTPSCGGVLPSKATWAHVTLDPDVNKVNLIYNGNTLNITTGNSLTYAAAYQGTCGSLTEVACAPLMQYSTGSYFFYSVEFNGLTPGTDLWIFVFNDNNKTFQIPVDIVGSGNLNLNGQSCGDASTSNSACNLGASAATFTTPVNGGQTCIGGSWSSNENTTYYSFVAPSTSFTLEASNIICNDGASGSIQFGVWASCPDIGTYTSPEFLGCSVGSASPSLSLTGLVPGQTYYIATDGTAGSNCKWEFNLPTADTCLTAITANDLIRNLCEANQDEGVAYDVDLTSYNDQVDGGNEHQITWYNDAALTQIISAPTNVQVNDGQSFYAEVTNGSCTDTAEINFNVVPSPLNLSVNATVSDCDTSTATAIVNVSGGATPYTYYWDNGSTDNNTNNLGAGVHYVNVSDNNGCSASKSFIVQNSSAPVISLNTIQPAVCFDNPTGGINIDVTGGASPYNYEWSTNATTQDINNLSRGVYEVTVTDANNCVSTEQFIVPGPNPIVFTTSVSYATCTMSNGSASVDTILGGIQPYSFLWSNSDTSQTVNSLSPGIYSVTVSDANGCSNTRYVEIHDNGAPTISVDNIIPATCGNTDGGVNITTSGTGNTFAWSNSTGNEDLTGVSSGTYQLTVTEPGGCQSFLSVVVPGETPNQQPICLITVNDTTNTNLIVWEKEVTTNIDHYNIYRESSAAGVYNLVHSQPYASLSQWTDSVASPMVRGWRYKISAVNNCGQESALSPLHKTIHLTINQGLPGSYNLIWDNYLGFTFPSFNIYRYTNAEGFVLINTLPSNLFSYTDNPPSVGGLYYIVEAVPPATCTSTLKAVNHNSTRSNKSNQSTSSTVTGIKDVIGENINIYPNPNSGSFNISGDILGSKIEVFNGLGQMVYNNSKLIENTLRIEGLSKGVYFLKVQNNNFIKTYKVVVE